MTKSDTAVVWLRRDLRLGDHPALTAALAGHSRIAPLFVADPRLLEGRFAAPARNAFLAACLNALDGDLRARGGRLFIRAGYPEAAVPAFAREVGASTVYVSRDYTPYSRRRDARVTNELARNGVRLEPHPGLLAVEPELVTTEKGEAYRVFSQFARRWSTAGLREALPPPASVPGPTEIDAGSFIADVAHTARNLPEGGEQAAQRRLAAWVGSGLSDYAEGRDRLDLEGTSRLGPDLHLGLVSPLQVLAATAARAGGDAQAFIRQIVWREFYHHLIWHIPSLAAEPLNARYRGLEWRRDEADLSAWKTGRTGYPVVDAAMRQLAATGWMPNRARMIVASFLTKDLLIDWREGESHFMRHLVDGDVANNNGGWQWAASTGADAQPYFRVFNPVLQGERFDPGGSYVRRWLPELGRVPLRHLHSPWTMSAAEQEAAGCLLGRDYPGPLVDHRQARQRALHFFREATS